MNKLEHIRQQLIQSELLTKKSAYTYALISTNPQFLNLYKYILSTNNIPFQDRTERSNYISLNYRDYPVIPDYKGLPCLEILILIYAKMYYGVKLLGINNEYTYRLLQWINSNPALELDLHVALRPYKSDTSFVPLNETRQHFSTVMQVVRDTLITDARYDKGGTMGIYIYKKRSKGAKYHTPERLYHRFISPDIIDVSPVEEEEVLDKLASLPVPYSKEIELERRSRLYVSHTPGIVKKTPWYIPLWNYIKSLFN